MGIPSTVVLRAGMELERDAAPSKQRAFFHAATTSLHQWELRGFIHGSLMPRRKVLSCWVQPWMLPPSLLRHR